jgi:nitrite reductase (NO-forming)
MVTAWAGRGPGPGRPTRRARRHLLVAGFVLGYLAAGGVVLALGDRIALGALPARLSGTVWFYVAAASALLAGMGLGLWLAGGVAGSADEYRALRLAHVHLNVLGWVGLAVVGTQFTLWPTVLRTHMVPGLEAAVRRSLPPLTAGMVIAAVGLALQERLVALAGLAAYAAGLALALVPFVHTARRRPPRTAAAWMLGAGMAWLVAAVLADLGALAATARVADLDGRLARLVPAVAAGFALQTLTGALTYLLPVVFGRGAAGNRRLTGILEWGWPARVAAVNLGVLVLVAGWGPAVGWWLVALGLGSFVPLAVAALVAARSIRP